MLGETLREIEGSPGGIIALELTPERLFSVEEIPDIQRIAWVRATSAGIRLFGEKGVGRIVNGTDRSQAYSLAASTLDLGGELVAPSVKSGNGYWSDVVVTNPFGEQQTFEVYGWKVIEDFINGRTRQQVRFASLSVAANGQVRRGIDSIFGPWAGEVEYVTVTVGERSANKPGRLAGMILAGHEQMGTMDAYEMTPCGEPRFVIYKRSDSFEHNDPAPIVEHTVILRGRFHQGHGSDYKIASREGLQPTRSTVILPDNDRAYTDARKGDIDFHPQRFPVMNGAQMYATELTVAAADGQGVPTSWTYELPGVTVRGAGH